MKRTTTAADGAADGTRGTSRTDRPAHHGFRNRREPESPDPVTAAVTQSEHRARDPSIQGMTPPKRRLLPTALAGLAVLAAATGCADPAAGNAAAPSPSAESSGGSSSAGSSSAAPSSSAATDELSTADELAAGLLPADAFGPEANVVTIDIRQVSTGASGGLPQGATITPPECGQGLGATTVSPEDFGVVVAQSATAPDGITVEVLAESEQVGETAPRFDELVEQCPRVTVDAPDGSSVTVDFAAFDVPDLGDASDGLRFTTAVSAADGTQVTVPSLLAVATEGPRMVFLQRTGADSAPLDEAAFTDLFERAVQTAQDA